MDRTCRTFPVSMTSALKGCSLFSGTVVAREYGLACVVAAHGATKLFVSGEKIHLDGSLGVVQSVDDDSLLN